MLLHLASTWVLGTQTQIQTFAQANTLPHAPSFQPSDPASFNWFIIKACYCGFGTVQFYNKNNHAFANDKWTNRSTKCSLHFLYLPGPGCPGLVLSDFFLTSQLAYWEKKKRERQNSNRQGRKDNVVPSHSDNYRVMGKVWIWGSQELYFHFSIIRIWSLF